MTQLSVPFLLAALAASPASAGPAEAKGLVGTQNAPNSTRPSVAEAEAQSPSRSGESEGGYLLRRETEVEMLWSLLTKKPFLAEEMACDYLVERNFEREEPISNGAEYGCAFVDEFTRHDRIAAATPKILAEYAALAKWKEFRIWLRAPVQEYDFKRGGYPIQLSDKAELDIFEIRRFYLSGAYFLLENAGRLSFAQIDAERARAMPLVGSWLELTIRPTGFIEKPFTAASTLKYIKARITRARLFATDHGSPSPLVSVVSGAQDEGEQPLYEFALDKRSSQGHRAR